MRHFIYGVFFLLISFEASTQIVPPYYTGFESNDPNWNHYPSTSVDDWQRGNGSNPYAEPFNGFFAWCTNVNNYFNQGIYYLESPSFDLSDTNFTYLISFYHKYNFANSNNSRGIVEYSIDNGINWNTLSITNQDEGENWHTSISWYEGFFNTLSYYKRARASLKNIQGNSNVKFRFNMFSPNDQGNYYGWIIDDFEVKILGKPDLRATNGGTVTSYPSNSQTFDVNLRYILEEEFKNYQGKTQIYYSSDNVLDTNDLFLDSINVNYLIYGNNLQYTVNNTGFIQGGINYIIYKHDYDGEIDEIDESNNIAYTIIDAEPVYNFPYHDQFETPNSDMKEFTCNGTSTSCQVPYTTSYGEHHSLSGAHTGNKCWHIENHQSLSNYYRRVEFPYMELDSNYVLHFFYKTKHNPSITFKRAYLWNGNFYWTSFGSLASPNYQKGWDYQSINIDSTWGPVFKMKIECSLGSWESGFAVDDLYMGPSKSDLLISKTETVRNTTVNLSTDTLYYYLINCGTESSISTTTKFYLSNDSILDVGDAILGQVVEPAINAQTELRRSFYYTKPNQTIGEYYIIAKVDADSVSSEMREYNNQRIFKVFQRNSVVAPYFNDFNTVVDDWFHYSDYKDNDAFFWGNADPKMTEISGKAFGVDSTVKPIRDTRSLLYTPVFDFTGMTKPVLMFDLALVANFSGYYNNQLNVDYSTDGGATWTLLDTTNGSFKRWYNTYDYSDMGGGSYIADCYSYDGFLYRYKENRFAENGCYFGEDDDSTRNAIIDVSHLKSHDRIQFRFNYGVTEEDPDSKLYIDNFEIKEGEVDLALDYIKDLFISEQSNVIELEYHIRNLGNYMNIPCFLNIYLSSDSLLDAGDQLVVPNALIDSIGPDQRKHFFDELSFNNGDLFGKNYIIFEIDPFNTIVESNESNNISFYRLKSIGVQNFPYMENFNEYEVHGWRSYNLKSGNYETRDHYFSNRVYSEHGWYDDYQIDGQMNVDKFNTTATYYPEVYLESPKFDLTNMDSVYLSFNYSMSTNQTNDGNQEGANLEYSLDGGQNWSVLGTDNDPNGINWYNRDNVGKLDYGPGWTNCDATYFTAIYNATSLLSNKTDVTFRFRMNSRWNCFYPGPSGLKMDNFRISDTLPEIDMVALHFGDTIDINHSATVPAQDDSIAFSIFNDGDIPGTSHINLYWSTDPYYDQNDQSAGTINFYSASAGDTSLVSGVVTYPTNSCDSSIYLIYRINPLMGTPSWTTSIPETDTTNNKGYFFVHLRGHDFLLPNNKLNFTNDTIICDGDSLVLELDSSYYNNNYSWSDGSSSNTLAVKDSGAYWVTVSSWYGCSKTSDTINVNFMPNDVTLYSSSNSFCTGDSVNLYILESGAVSWSASWSNDSSIYVQSSGEHVVTLTNLNGCVSTDTVTLQMAFDGAPIISNFDSIHYCYDVATVEAIMDYDNYMWNTGDTTRVITFSNDGIYYLQVNNSCGLQTSDTLYANFHHLIDSVDPGFEVLGCEGDVVNFTAYSSSSNINWYQATGINNTLYSEYFSYPNGPLYPNIQMLPWVVTSNDPNFMSKVGISSGRLEVNPTGDSIIFFTDPVDISDYYSIDLRVNAGNQLSDSVYVYYQLDNGAWKRFENNGAFALSPSILATHTLLEGSVVKIKVVFNGVSTYSSFNQSINDIVIDGNQKTNSWHLQTGNTYSHTVWNDDYFILTADNGYCVEEKIIVLEESDFNLSTSSQYVCSNENDTLCPFNTSPFGYSYNWLTNPFVYGSDSSCVFVNAMIDTNIVCDVTNIDGCSKDYYINLNVTDIDTSISVTGNTISSNSSGFYQWLDCNNNFSPIIGANSYSYTPQQDGVYAVQITYGSCIDTSACIVMTCVNPIDPNVNVVGSVLTAVQTGASYQWIDCNGNTPISGATSQTFSPTVNGQYAVILTLGNCVDTSTCINVNNVSIDEQQINSKVYVFPNPTKDVLEVVFGVSKGEVELVLFNALGEKVIRNKYSNTRQERMDLTMLPKGIYALKVKIDSKEFLIKVVKE